VNPEGYPQQKNRRGCLFYAVVIAGVLVLLLLLGLVAGYYGLRKAVTTYTATAPASLPEVQAPPAEVSAVQKRVDNFRDNLRARLPAPPLVLTDREINALITSSAEFKELSDKLRLRIENGRLRGQISLPLEETGVGFLQGRYLNGIGTFQARIDEGRLRVTLAEMEVNGKPLPARWMSRLRNINFAQKVNEDPQLSTALGALQSIEAKNNTLVLTPQPAGN